MNFLRSFTCVAFAASLLFLGACTTNQTITTVEAVVAASEAVVTALPNIPAATKTEVTGYLGNVSSAVSCTNAELSTADVGTVRALKITACFTGVTIVGLSASAQSYVSAVNAAVQALLSVFAPAQPAATSSATLNTAAQAKVATLQVRNSAVAAQVAH